MPDQFGRLSLAEMRAYVLRNLASYVATTIDPTTGIESGGTSLGTNLQFTQQNLNLRINSSTTKVSLLINANNETILAKEVFYDAVPGVTLYKLPPDLMQLRGLWWRNPGSTLPATPEDYNPMSQQDVLEDGGLVGGVTVTRPSWRLVGNSIQLNQDPADYIADILDEGIWVKYVRWVQFLQDDVDHPAALSYLDLPFAQVVQEVVVWDATLDLLKTQEEVVDAKGVETTLAYWNAQLEILVRNQYRPPEIRLIGPSMVKGSWSGH